MTPDDFPIQDSGADASAVSSVSGARDRIEENSADEMTSSGSEAVEAPVDEPVEALVDASSEAEPTSDELPQVSDLDASSVSVSSADATESAPSSDLKDLQQQKVALEQEIAQLQAARAALMAEQTADAKTTLEQLIQSGLSELEQRKQVLQAEVERLERRQERIQAEMRTSFAGVSQELAVRVKGFKDYLVGSLQDLAAAAEQLDLQPAASQKAAEPRSRRDREPEQPKAESRGLNIAFADDRKFQEQLRQIRGMLDRYRTQPEYYGPPWQLRRTFEPIHAERVGKWFFSQGGRGATRTMGSRLQNILITSAVISILRTLYGDRVRALVLANTPERLGEWRRGLQDCLGISRSDFGPNRGAILFEEAEPLAMKAERLLEDDYLPFIAIDETEDRISLSILQFPLWLAFAPNPEFSSSGSSYSGYSFER